MSTSPYSPHVWLVAALLLAPQQPVGSAKAVPEGPQEAVPFRMTVRAVPGVIASTQLLRLDARVEYTGATPITAEMPESAFESALTITPPGGERFHIIGDQLFTTLALCRFPAPDQFIQPGHTSVFSIQVVYDWKGRRFLFEKPGTYRVKVHCRMAVARDGLVNLQSVTSVATVQVRETRGLDVGLWKKAVQAGALTGEHRGRAQGFLKQITAKHPRSPYRADAMALLTGALSGDINVADPEGQISALQAVLKQYPNYSYRDAVAAQLAGLLVRQGEMDRSAKWRQMVLDDAWSPASLKRQVRNFEPGVLFPKDRRLDQMVTYEFLQHTAVSEVVAELTRQSGVPLTLHPASKGTFSALRATRSLREAMRRVQGIQMWVREGDGYKLVPKDLNRRRPS